MQKVNRTWKSSTMLCLLFWDSSGSTFCILLIKMSCSESYTAWRIEETTERKGEEKAWPSCYCSCLPIKKIGKRFLSLTAITASSTVSNAWIMCCQLKKNRPNLLVSKGHFTAGVYIWQEGKRDCIISDIWHLLGMQLLAGVTSMINMSLLQKIDGSQNCHFSNSFFPVTLSSWFQHAL